MPRLWSIAKVLFILCLVLLPFAEWRIFYLPLNGRTGGIDWVGYRSASAFDLTFFVFVLSLLPFVWRFVKERRFINRYLLFWAPAIILVPVLYIYLRPKLPYLMPSQPNVIDTRSFIIHFVVAVGVTISLSGVGIERIIKGSYFFYSAMISFFILLSAFALTEISYFSSHYPFTAPFTISFPFPNQNVAAPFITICLMGILGAAVAWDRKRVLLLAIPLGILAAALTGSRSNMLILMGSLSIFVMSYVAWCLRQHHGMNEAKVINVIGGLAAVVVAVTLVLLSYDWQPVRRSLSIFGNLLGDPIGLVMGIRGSPRWELWSGSLSGERIEGKDKSEKYKMYITSIENGRVTKGETIIDLEVGRKYYIRLRARRTLDGLNVGLLEVFSDKNRHHLVAKSAGSGRTGPLKNVFLFVSDTGNKRGLVTISASLDNYTINGGNNKDVNFTLSDDERLNWYEEWYDEKYGDSGGVIRSDKNELTLVAYEQQVRAYVDRVNVLDENDLLYTLEYDVIVHNLEADWPITGPARFYVGFHDGNPSPVNGEWEKIRNGLLIGHEHILSPYKARVLYSRTLERLADGAGGLSGNEGEEVWKGDNQTVNDGTVRIEGLWRPEIAKEEIMKFKQARLGERTVDTGMMVETDSVRKGNAYIGKTDAATAPDMISIVPDETWSAKAHLVKKGSTHNVYLDWYHYVGKIPFGLFMLFILLLLRTMTEFVWRRRNSPFAGFYLATWLQIIVVVVAMYAHPGIWIKYIWFLFGVAGAVMISDEKGENEQKGVRF